MYNFKIKELISQKIEYDIYILKECLELYLKLYIIFPDNLEIRKKFISFIKDYYSYSFLEYEILVKIKKIEENEKIKELCIDMLEELEKIFFKVYNYNEYVLGIHEDALLNKDINRIGRFNREFDVISSFEKDVFIKKLNNKG